MTSSQPQDLAEVLRRLQKEIAERKRTEDLLLIEKAYWEQLFESAPEAIVLVDNDDRVLRANGEFGRVFGFAREEYLGRRINELIVPENLRQEASAFSDT